MPGGIIIFGANGSGKSTVGREVARVLKFKYMDIEAYHFIESVIPYTAVRPRQECLDLMLADIEKYHSFVMTAVTGDLGEQISSMYEFAVFLSAPLELRIERIKQRTYEQYRERVCAGGDMYEQNLRFIDFVASRSLIKIEQWTETLKCPVIQIDGTNPVHENTEVIVREYLSVLSSRRDIF